MVQNLKAVAERFGAFGTDIFETGAEKKGTADMEQINDKEVRQLAKDETKLPCRGIHGKSCRGFSYRE
jgi:hypothetical protein